MYTFSQGVYMLTMLVFGTLIVGRPIVGIFITSIRYKTSDNVYNWFLISFIISGLTSFILILCRQQVAYIINVFYPLKKHSLNYNPQFEMDKDILIELFGFPSNYKHRYMIFLLCLKHNNIQLPRDLKKTIYCDY